MKLTASSQTKKYVKIVTAICVIGIMSTLCSIVASAGGAGDAGTVATYQNVWDIILTWVRRGGAAVGLFGAIMTALGFKDNDPDRRTAGVWTIPTGITQNVADVLRSPLAQTMIANTQFVIMLSQNTTDREQLSHLLHIEPETMRYVTNASPGCGLIYADKFGVIPFDNTFPTNTEIYKIITTKFGEELIESAG